MLSLPFVNYDINIVLQFCGRILYIGEPSGFTSVVVHRYVDILNRPIASKQFSQIITSAERKTLVKGGGASPLLII